MAYIPQTWANGVLGGTPISAARLQHMEEGIANPVDSIPEGTYARVNEGPLSFLDSRVAESDDLTVDMAAAWGRAKALMPAGETGNIFFPPGRYKTLTPLVGDINSQEQMKLSGVGLDSIIEGTGFEVFDFSGSNGPILEDLMVRDPVGHASTVLLNLTSGPYPGGGMSNAELRNVYLRGNGDLAEAARLGIGIKGLFSLKGNVVGGAIEYLNQGVVLEDASNAWAFLGTKVRGNVTGFVLGQAGQVVTDVFLLGCTVEGNALGVLTGVIATTMDQCHFENHADGEVVVTSGALKTSKSYFAPSGSTSPIQIQAGSSSLHSSDNDAINPGSAGSIRHLGTGVYILRNPQVAYVEDAATTGRVITQDPTSHVQQSGGVLSHTVSDGFLEALFGQKISGKAGTDTIIGSKDGQVIRFVDPVGVTLGYFDPSVPMLYLPPATKLRIDGELDQRGAAVTLLNKAVSEGAADSGGAGFKTLRVPN